MDIRFNKTWSFPQCNGDSKVIEAKLWLLTRFPQSQYFSLQQVCEFYEVEPDEVRKILKECAGEFRDENVISVSEDTQEEFVEKYGNFEPKYYEPTSEMWTTELGDKTLSVPKVAMLMFPLRAVRRMGLLVSGAVAEARRREMLNILFGS